MKIEKLQEVKKLLNKEAGVGTFLARTGIASGLGAGIGGIHSGKKGALKGAGIGAAASVGSDITGKMLSPLARKLSEKILAKGKLTKGEAAGALGLIAAPLAGAAAGGYGGYKGLQALQNKEAAVSPETKTRAREADQKLVDDTMPTILRRAGKNTLFGAAGGATGGIIGSLLIKAKLRNVLKNALKFGAMGGAATGLGTAAGMGLRSGQLKKNPSLIGEFGVGGLHTNMQNKEAAELILAGTLLKTATWEGFGAKSIDEPKAEKPQGGAPANAEEMRTQGIVNAAIDLHKMPTKPQGGSPAEPNTAE